MKNSDKLFATDLTNWCGEPNGHHVRKALSVLVFACATAGCSNGTDNDIQAKKTPEEIAFERCKSKNFEFYARTGDSWDRAEQRATLTCIGERERTRNTNTALKASSSGVAGTAQPTGPNAATGSGKDELDRDLSVCAASMNELEFLDEAYGKTKVLSRNPLRVQIISTPVVDGESESEIRDETKRAVVSLVFQTFAYSKETQVAIESVPMRVGKGFKPVGLMEPYRIKLSVTREAARKVIKSLMHVNTFGDLFPPFEPGSDVCLGSDKMTGAMFNDQGPPTLDRVIAALKAPG